MISMFVILGLLIMIFWFVWLPIKCEKKRGIVRVLIDCIFRREKKESVIRFSLDSV